MPTYQYSCTECGHFFEQFQSFSEDSLTVCPQCQGRLRKVFNAVGVVFKGSGFYRTDSRSKAASGNSAGSSSDGAKKESPAPAAAASGSSSPAIAPARSGGSSTSPRGPIHRWLVSSASTSNSASLARLGSRTENEPTRAS